MVVLQRSILFIIEYKMNAHRLDQLYGYRLENKGFNPEYLQQQSQGVIAKDVGENPLNRKGMLSAHNGGDEEIVESHVKA